MPKAYDEDYLPKQPGTPLPGVPKELTSDLPQACDDLFKRKGYSLFKGPGEVNIIYIEGMNTDGTPNDNAPNRFNDVRLVMVYEGGKPVIKGLWDATTEPGRYWTQNPMNRGGAARIKFGQYTAWQLGKHHDHEALVQTGGPVTVCRDLNKDYKRVGDAEDTGMFGINQHWGYDLSASDLGRSSAGCLVGRTKNGHRKFMEIVKSDPRFLANGRFKFTATVAPFADL